MNELKHEDVMRALEEFASLTNCNNMRYLEGCGHFCKVLRESIDDMAGGRSPKCNEHCEHYSPPRDEELFRATLALFREKDALIEDYRQELGRARVALNDANAEIERLEALNSKLLEKCSKVRDEAISEFSDMVCDGRVSNDPVVIAVRVAEKEMKEGER